MGNFATKSEQEGDFTNAGQGLNGEAGSVGQKDMEPHCQLAQDVAKQIDVLQSIIASRSRCQSSIAACKNRIGTRINANSINNSIKNESTVEPEPADANAVVTFCAEPTGANGNTYCTLEEEDSLNSPTPVQNTDEQPDKSVVGKRRDFQENRGKRNGILQKLPARGKGRSTFAQNMFARGCLCVVGEEDEQTTDNPQEQNDSAQMRATVPH